MKQFVKEILLFALVLIVVLSMIFYFAYPSYVDGIYDMTIFYQLEKNTVDVLVLGSSHAFEGINTNVLWHNAGISSFTLAGSEQPFWNTYYYLKEALKYQTPQLIVLDVYSATKDYEYSDNSRIIKNTFGLKNSEDRLNAIKVSSPEDQLQNYLLGIPAYHSMVLDVTAKDLMPYKGDSGYYKNWKGFLENYETLAVKDQDLSKIEEIGCISDKTYEYFIKTIELAKTNDIPILLITIPYFLEDEEDQKIYNRVAQIAQECGVKYVDFNQSFDQIGLDISTDFGDCHHLNYLGNVKFTTALADYISKNYEVSDRRGDAKWQSWEDCYQYWLGFREKRIVKIQKGE